MFLNYGNCLFESRPVYSLVDQVVTLDYTSQGQLLAESNPSIWVALLTLMKKKPFLVKYNMYNCYVKVETCLTYLLINCYPKSLGHIAICITYECGAL